MSKNENLGKDIKDEIKKMYESGISATLIASAIKKKYNKQVAVNSIRQWASNNKWKRQKTVELKETLNTLPQSIKNEIEKIDKTLKDEPDNAEILARLSNLFEKAYNELDYRLSDKVVSQNLDVDDLIKIIKTSSDALIELRKVNKHIGDVYIQFNFDIDYDKKNPSMEKIIEIQNETPAEEVKEVKDDFVDVFEELKKTAMNINIVRKIQ